MANKRKTSRTTAKPRKGAAPSGKKVSSTDSDREVISSEMEQGDPNKKPFTPETLDKTVIAIPLLKRLEEEKQKRKLDPSLPREIFPIIIDLNLEYPNGRQEAREWVSNTTEEIIKNEGHTKQQGINQEKSALTEQYLFGALEGDVIRQLVNRDRLPKDVTPAQAASTSVGPRAIYHIWPDFPVHSLINRSISTVKADAAQSSFAAFGDGIVWAVLDSGIEGGHEHFALYENLKLKSPLQHIDFTKFESSKPEDALHDGFGHGTHVAGIIGGCLKVSEDANAAKGKRKAKTEIMAYSRHRDESGDVTYDQVNLTSISGMAPKCKLLSFKVLDDEGKGSASNLIAAIAKIQDINGHGRRLLIHGVNMSVGYDFEPEWFACGQSPLCVEVDRLVRSGVVVVVAAGNTGYGTAQSQFRGVISAGMDLTINDPGNAELAITVGSTHRDMPHVYGVSYFSSKGPTGDGRAKPDLVAPGEKIISCAAGKRRKEMEEKGKKCNYLEESGTSMAAPHVSGVIAAFLSIRREFIGQPERVKEIFCSTATDLKRERYFQGHGLVDLMRAIQSV